MTFVVFVLGAIVGFLGGVVCGVIVMAKIEEDVCNQMADGMRYFHRFVEKTRWKEE